MSLSMSYASIQCPNDNRTAGLLLSYAVTAGALMGRPTGQRVVKAQLRFAATLSTLPVKLTS